MMRLTFCSFLFDRTFLFHHMMPHFFTKTMNVQTQLSASSSSDEEETTKLSYTVDVGGGVQRKFYPIAEANMRANRLPRLNRYNLPTQASPRAHTKEPLQSSQTSSEPSEQQPTVFTQYSDLSLIHI